MENKNTTILFLVLAAGLLLFLNNSVFMPLFRANSALVKQNQETKNQIESITSIYAKENFLEEARQKIDSLESFYRQRIPEEISLSESNYEIISIIENYPVELTSISFSQPRQGTAQIMPAMAVDYQKIIININLLGEFSSIINCLAEISRLTRQTPLTNLSLETPRAGQAKTQARATFESYALKNIPAARAAGQIKLNRVYLRDSLSIRPAPETVKKISPEKNIFRLPEPTPKEALPEPEEILPVKGFLPEDFRLQGTVVKSQASNSAIINGNLYREGDRIEGYLIKEIKEKEVFLERNQKVFILK